MTDKLIATNREDGGKLAKIAQMKWLQTQEGFQHSRITPWEELPEECKEEWRVIWEGIALPYLEVIRSLHSLSGVFEDLALLELDSLREDNKRS